MIVFDWFDYYFHSFFLTIWFDLLWGENFIFILQNKNLFKGTEKREVANVDLLPGEQVVLEISMIRYYDVGPEKKEFLGLLRVTNYQLMFLPYLEREISFRGEGENSCGIFIPLASISQILKKKVPKDPRTGMLYKIKLLCKNVRKEKFGVGVKRCKFYKLLNLVLNVTHSNFSPLCSYSENLDSKYFYETIHTCCFPNNQFKLFAFYYAFPDKPPHGLKFKEIFNNLI